MQYVLKYHNVQPQENYTRYTALLISHVPNLTCTVGHKKQSQFGVVLEILQASGRATEASVTCHLTGQNQGLHAQVQQGLHLITKKYKIDPKLFMNHTDFQHCRCPWSNTLICKALHFEFFIFSPQRIKTKRKGHYICFLFTRAQSQILIII